MSSKVVRDALNQAMTTLAAPYPVFDLSDYVSLDEVLASISSNSVLMQYVVAGDDMVDIGGEGNQGWEETGSVAVHIVTPTGFASGPVVTKGDEIRVGIRGRRLAGDVLVESCTPFTDFGAGGVNGATHTWVANLFYSRRVCG